ncbi:quinone-dependent dihydroorotate dehydrogenase [Streptomyces sp. WMMC500]|uniref:quinone-dependent dihydroorotate dehydrogenase n=1 Tax=Streptomyces sp. WMMC500 TaxID=3015154 RepID=UPI00248D241E|nr:quinone-dependent dihydroorotate dehydrogenase [Streptomyces sp. WMMC500]WBB60476.1 quinone-dependent dihydroorotate dehydrogenase [Streptomyces sp. WMMC500]
MYPLLFHSLFARMDPERAHRLAFAAIRGAAAAPGVRGAVRVTAAPRHPGLRVRALGIDFPGPFGLAAGFDKNAVGVDGLTMLGFDFVEVGTVTAGPQPGNPPTRLFRLIPDRALVNRMGFNNDGSAAVAARLARRRYGQRTPYRPNAVVGVNIGKTKAVPESGAIADYVTATERLAGHADYLVVNVSSPNTPGLRDLQATRHLRPLLEAVRAAADRVAGDAAPAASPGAAAAPGRPARVPLLVKIAPDLADEDVDAVADLSLELGLDGIIATNTTVARDGLTTAAARVESIGAGGLSGAPLRRRSLEVLRRLYARVGAPGENGVVLVGAGGIETAEHAWERILAGATLVQGYSGFVYEGPLWPRRIHRGLAELLATSPYATLADAVGADVRKATA